MSVSLAFCDVEPAFSVAVSLDDPEVTQDVGSSRAGVAEIRNHLLTQICERISAEVLDSATEPDDLLARLDDTLSDPAFRVLRRDLNGLVSLDMVRRTLEEGHVPAAIAKAAGASLARELRVAIRLQSELTRVLLIVLAHSERSSSLATKAANRKDRVVVARVDRPAFESRAPVAAKRAMWGLERVGGAIWALQALDGRSTEAWVPETLFKIWIESATDALRLFAGFPGADVPTELVPVSERLDVLALQEAHQEAELGYKTRLAAARDSEADVYPPLNGPIRD